VRLYLSSFRMGDNPDHPETAAIERVVARYRADGTPYRALHDGQALFINGPQTMIV
jgi:phytoene/squalene synthetase